MSAATRAFLIGTLFLLAPHPGDARVTADRALVRLPGHVLPALSGATPVASETAASPSDRRDEAQTLTLTVVLKRDDPAGFERHLRDVYDPASPTYRKFPSPARVSDLFGPSRSAYAAVRRHLQRHGFAVVEDSTNRMTLTVRGTRAAAERAFAVRIADYELGGKRFYANVEDPALPRDVAAHVAAVAGLANLATPHPAKEFHIAVFSAVCTIGAFLDPYYLYVLIQSPADSVAAQAAYLSAFAKCVNNNATAAGYGKLIAVDPPPPAWQGADGTGQTVGIVAFDTFRMSDVRDYVALMDLPANQIDKVSQVHVNGGAGATPGPDQDEVLLDIAVVMGIAPGANVAVYDAPFTGPNSSFQSVFNAMIDDGVDVISNSWAYCENQTSLADVQGIDAILATAAASGISVFNATGDTGTTCLNGSPNTAAVPASSPHATAVGGTSLTLGPGFVRESETWWDGTDETPPSGQGGFGTSRFFARPSYQDGSTTAPMRSLPDVAANADPAKGVVICAQDLGGCPTGAIYGGTSAAAPLWAAATALLNQTQGANLGFLNPLVYPLAGTDAFYDAASMGTDFAHVGLGSPNLARLHQRLTSQTPGAVSASVSVVRAVGPGNALLPADDGVATAVPADGTTAAHVVVRLADGNGNPVGGKNVTLASSPPGSVTIDPPVGVSRASDGAVVFTLTDLVPEILTITATDATDGVVLLQTATIGFAVPKAASGGIQAFPLTVPTDGTSTTTITVTLQDGLGRPASDKEIRLSQGSGHAIVTGPKPSVTDAAGQIQFTVTNRVNEVVTFTATDVTDGDLPVPGNVQVTWNGTSTSCVGAPPVAQDGYAVTPFANGFVAQNFFYGNVNWNGCPGASVPAFRGGDVFIADFATGGFYRFDVNGGAVSSADLLNTLGKTIHFPVVGKDGKLYAAFGSSGAGGATGSIVEVDPTDGTVVRTLAANQKCPAGLAVDPLSGDLFFTGDCFGGLEDPVVHRIRDPESASPTLENYATLSATPSGVIAFAPNGTLYVATQYTATNPPVVRIAGTDKPSPTQTVVAGVSSIFWVTVGAADAAGEATALLGLTSKPGGGTALEYFDLTTDPPTTTTIATNLAPGPIGPDGCLYAPGSDTIYKVTRADGTCGFSPGGALRALTLAPATVAPDPAQGTSQTLTATFRNVDVPAGTPVFFVVTGANPRVQLASTDDDGNAVLTYVAKNAGTDTIQAHAIVGDETLYSNDATIRWAAGRHTTSLTLNLAPRGATVGIPSVLTAALVDTSVEPNQPIAGQTVTFTRGDAQCTAVTDASGRATCVLLADPGRAPLTASFSGSADLAPATTTIGFSVVGGGGLGPFGVYAAKPSKGTAKFVKFGAVTLADAVEPGGVGYDVQKLETLASPADANGIANPDPDTHLASYAVKRAKSAPKFVKRTDVRFANQCSDSVVTLGKPASVLVPTAEDPTNPPTAPDEADHDVDHFLCYKAKAQKKRADGTPAPVLRKGLQVDVADEFQTTRYDLGKVVLACNPVAKSGSPVQLAGASAGSPFPITPATVRNPATRLLCYSAKIATKRIEQAGCGPTTPGDKGTKIVPKQPKHAPRLGLHLANQFGAATIDTKKATLVCLPSVALP